MWDHGTWLKIAIQDKANGKALLIRSNTKITVWIKVQEALGSFSASKSVSLEQGNKNSNFENVHCIGIINTNKCHHLG